MIVTRNSGNPSIGKIYFKRASGGIEDEKEKYYGLVQSSILDDFLYRDLRRYWLFDTGGDIVT